MKISKSERILLNKKCKQCLKCDFTNKYCKHYNKPLSKELMILCEVDKRKLCSLCSNWDKNTEYCSLAKMGKFKDGDTLRMCEYSFKLKE